MAPRAGHHDRTFRNHQRLVVGRGEHFAADHVVNRRRARQNHAAAEHRALLDHRAFVDSAIPADQHVVFDDHRHRAHRFQHSADLRRGGNVAILADLRAASDQRVRIDHGPVAHVRARIDVHRAACT